MTGSSQPNSGAFFATLRTAISPNRAIIWRQLVTKLMMVQSKNHIDEILDNNRMNEECLEDVPEEQLKTSLKHALQKITENKLGETLNVTNHFNLVAIVTGGYYFTGSCRFCFIYRRKS